MFPGGAILVGSNPTLIIFLRFGVTGIREVFRLVFFLLFLSLYLFPVLVSLALPWGRAYKK
jgi:hypothetical protein